MTHSADCTALVASFEGLKTTAYDDGRGIPTIGYGHTVDVHMGDTCTIEQATDWLNYDMATADAAVNRLITAPLNQHQFDALVSFTYNLGSGNLAKSTLLKKLNASDYAGAAEEFLVWDNPKSLSGIAIRRAKEKALFLEPEE